MRSPLLASTLLAVFGGVTTGCGSTIQLEVLEPAAVSVPTHIQTIAVIDRSKAKNVGQGLLGALEGALTGEAIGADTEGRREAMGGLFETLQNSPRYEVVQPVMKNKDLESSLFDSTMSWETAKQICGMAHCQGIVTLEAFDSDKNDDWRVEEVTSTNSDGKEVKKTVHRIQREMRVLSAWRLYDVINRVVIDDLRDHATARSWTETGDTKADAKRKLPDNTDMVRTVARSSGNEYGRRIAPVFVWVNRSFFGGGDPRLKDAKVHVRATDWPGAAEIWKSMLNDPDPKLKGKAMYNLALSREVEGDLQGALEYAQKAHTALNKGTTRRYVQIVNQRISDQARLAAQLAPPPPAPEKPERPVHP